MIFIDLQYQIRRLNRHCPTCIPLLVSHCSRLRTLGGKEITNHSYCLNAIFSSWCYIFGCINSLLLPLHQCALSIVHSVLTRDLWGKNPQAYHSGRIRTTDLCIARADVLPLDYRASLVARGSISEYRNKINKFLFDFFWWVHYVILFCID